MAGASVRFFAVLALALVASTTAGPTRPATFASVAEAATKTKNLSTLLSLVVQANLTSALGPDAKLTVFAPTNNAFAALPADLVKTVTGNNTLLTGVLTYHVSSTIVPNRALFQKKTAVKTLLGQDVTLGMDGKILTVKGAGNAAPARVLRRIKAGKSVVYMISQVLLPAP